MFNSRSQVEPGNAFLEALPRGLGGRAKERENEPHPKMASPDKR
jgi:hypothetical protein